MYFHPVCKNELQWLSSGKLFLHVISISKSVKIRVIWGCYHSLRAVCVMIPDYFHYNSSLICRLAGKIFLFSMLTWLSRVWMFFSWYYRPTQITARGCRLELVKAPEYIFAMGNQLLSITKGDGVVQECEGWLVLLGFFCLFKIYHLWMCFHS